MFLTTQIQPPENLLRVYLVEDEPLALKRLKRLLAATGRVNIVGATDDPNAALEEIPALAIDALFLDIELPLMDGFALLSQLPVQPPVIFTTGHNHYALEAFKTNSISYLLKPIDLEQINQALDKLLQLRFAPSPLHVQTLAQQLSKLIQPASQTITPETPEHIASRVGNRTRLIKLASITHFIAQDKLTYAVTETGAHTVENSIRELEQRFERGFVRITRGALVNVAYISELRGNLTTGFAVRLSDAPGTKLSVSRDRIMLLRKRLGL